MTKTSAERTRRWSMEAGLKDVGRLNGREVARRRLVLFCLAFFIAILIAGPLRKWVSPGLHQYLAFIHLPILCVIYIYCLVLQFWPKMTSLLAASAGMALVVIGIAVVQALNEAIIVPEIAISTWIGYFGFIPLCFIISEYFTQKDIERFAVWSLLFMIVNTSIMFIQKDYPEHDVINQGFGEGSDEVFSGLNLIDGLTRPMGIFTSPLGNSIFVLYSVSLFWMLFITTRKIDLRGWFFWPALLVSGVGLVLAGSRYAILSFALLVVSTMVAAGLSQRSGTRMRGVTQAVIAVTIMGGIGLSVFRDQVDLLSRRFDTAWEEEQGEYRSGTLSRLFLETDIGEVFANMDDTPFLGYGLGTGSNAAYILGHIPIDLYREAPWAKHMNDIGLFFSILYIFLRLSFVLRAAVGVLADCRRFGDAAALALFSQVSVQMLVGQTVSHVVVGPLTWLFFGLLLAWLRQSQENVATRAM